MRQRAKVPDFPLRKHAFGRWVGPLTGRVAKRVLRVAPGRHLRRQTVESLDAGSRVLVEEAVQMALNCSVAGAARKTHENTNVAFDVVPGTGSCAYNSGIVERGDDCFDGLFQRLLPLRNG